MSFFFISLGLPSSKFQQDHQNSNSLKCENNLIDNKGEVDDDNDGDNDDDDDNGDDYVYDSDVDDGNDDD